MSVIGVTSAYSSTSAVMLANIELSGRVVRAQWQENCQTAPFRMFNVGLRAVAAKYARKIGNPA